MLEVLWDSSKQASRRGEAWRIIPEVPHGTPHPCPTGQNAIKWPHSTARQAGKCSLYHGDKLSGIDKAPL